MTSPSALQQLAGDQGRLAQVLRDRDIRHGSAFADIYVGAIISLNEPRPDHLAHAAHGIRELLDKLPYIYPDAPIRRVGDVATSMRTVADEMLRAKDTSSCFSRESGLWTGRVDNPLRALLATVDTATPAITGFPSRRDVQQLFFRSLEPSNSQQALPGEEDRLKHWARLYGYFTGVAHHDRSTSREELEARVVECTTMVLELLRPSTSEILSQLDAIIEEGQ